AITRTSRASSGILQYYTLEDVGDIFPPVGGVFQVLIDFTPFNYLTGIEMANLEQLSQGSMFHIVCLGENPQKFCEFSGAP
ncbi:unnamed protein product, partial [marine sediment metagenome]